MPDLQPVVSHLHINVGGEELAPPLHSHVLQVTVDQQVHLPSMFEIRLYDPGMKLLDAGPFHLAAPVTIVAKTVTNQLVPLIAGEITALEPHFGRGMIGELLVRGYDPSHRLYRVRNARTYLNVKDSDLAKEFAEKAKLSAEVDPTATVYDHLYQCNLSDLQFLQQRAWRIGYECHVDEGVLYFRKPRQDKAQAAIAWGEDLLSFRPRLTIAEQVKETLVRGWDVQRKTPVIGRAGGGSLYPKFFKDQANGSVEAGAFGESRMVIVDQPVTSQAEADILAAARQNELSGAFVEADGEAFRRPDIRAGRLLAIKGLGTRLSGDYLVTRATHVYTSAGLKVFFSVTGARSGLLLDQMHAGGTARWAGAVTAIVTNTDDPNGWGRVKVKYPWVTDEDESFWARVVAAGAGPDAGLATIPAVDDEVLVVFLHGNFDQPCVLGGLWNGLDGVPPATASAPAGEKPLVRSWRSRTGHHITVYDNADNKVEVATHGGHHLRLDDANGQITLRSAGGLEVVLDDAHQKVSVTSSDTVEVTATRALTLKAANVKVEASGSLDLQASGPVRVKGATVSLN
jgi:phage protein D